MRAGADLHAEVAHLALHEPQHGHHALGGVGRLLRDGVDLRAQRGRGRRGHLVQRLGPARHVAPTREGAPFGPRERVVGRRRGRLHAQAGLVAKIPHAFVEPAHLRDLRRRRAVALRHGQRHAGGSRQPSIQVRDGHLEAHVERAAVMAREHGVGAGAHVGELEDVADADVRQIERDRLAAVVDAGIEIALALQHLHLHVAQARDAVAVADDVQLRQRERLPARIDLDLLVAQLVDALRGDRLADDVVVADARGGREPHLIVDHVETRAVGHVGGVRLPRRGGVEGHRLDPGRREADAPVGRAGRRPDEEPGQDERRLRRPCRANALACHHGSLCCPVFAPVGGRRSISDCRRCAGAGPSALARGWRPFGVQQCTRPAHCQAAVINPSRAGFSLRVSRLLQPP